MSTPVLSPMGLPYPITVDRLLPRIGTHLEKGERLFAYKFWYMVEMAGLSSEDNIGGSGDSTDYKESGGQHLKKTIRESIEFFEAPFEGDLVSWNVDVGDEIASANQIICEITRPCNHDVVYAGICTMCGKEVDESDQVAANLAMSHTDTNLRISMKEATEIETTAKARLQKDKKLILVVDLDQTVIHCGVDPTIGEWKNDPSNPNYDTLKDVKSFSLDEETIIPPLYMGPIPPARKCWYYVKVRPGLKEFFAKVAPLYEMHIYTMATRAYALEIAKIIDPDRSFFGNRILSRDENGSLTHKSLERLFPTDQSMVVIIDDRGDVWNWCPNLIKVTPYNFFVGIGDINSNFLPRQQATMLQMGRKSQKKPKSEELLIDIMDSEKKLQEKIEKEVKKQEERLKHQPASVGEENSSIGTEDITKKLEFSASLEVQQQNRPLAELQKHMHNKQLLTDEDDELLYLKDILAKVHDTFYSEANVSDASIQTLVPQLKQKVFVDCHFVFSGLIPLGTDINKADIVLWTRMFGAQSSADIDENTTHLITKSAGTYKARIAKRFNPKIKIVHPDWVFECLITWQRINEKPYELLVKQPATDEELDQFRSQLQKRKDLDEKKKLEKDIATENNDNFSLEGTFNLFAEGTSWLNNDEDEDIPITSEDEEDEEYEAGEQAEGDLQTNVPLTKKRPLEDDIQLEKKETDKRAHHSPQQISTDDDSDLEEELLNALDE